MANGNKHGDSKSGKSIIAKCIGAAPVIVVPLDLSWNSLPPYKFIISAAERVFMGWDWCVI